MKRILLAIVLLTIANVAAAQVPFPIPPGYRICWDQSTPADVTRFESNLDGGAFGDVGKVPESATSPNSFCQPFPAVTLGTHNYQVRACNVYGCSATLPFDFTVGVVPGVPSNIHIVPPPSNRVVPPVKR